MALTSAAAGTQVASRNSAGARADRSTPIWGRLALLPLVTLFVALRLWDLTAYSIWGGEAFTIVGARRDWPDLLAYAVADIVHPPFIYVLLKLWLAVGGESILWLKLFPVVAAIAVLPAFLGMAREIGMSLPEMAFALYLFAVNAFVIHYSQEIRMYSLFVTLTIYSLWLYIRVYNSTGLYLSNYAALFLVNLALIYTHYYGWMVVVIGAGFIWFFKKTHRRSCGLMLVGLIMSFLPWLFLVFQSAVARRGLKANLGWIARPNIESIVDLYSYIHGYVISRDVSSLGFALFLGPIVVFLWLNRRRLISGTTKDLAPITLVASVAFLPVMFIAIISRFFPQSTWIDRYFVFTIAPYFALVSIAVFRVFRGWALTLMLTILTIWAGGASLAELRANRIAWEIPQAGSRMQWSSITHALVRQEGAHGTKVTVYTLPTTSKRHLTGDWAVSTSIGFYLGEMGEEERFAFKYAINEEALRAAATEDHFWVAFFELMESQGGPSTEKLRAFGFRLGPGIEAEGPGGRLWLLPVWR